MLKRLLGNYSKKHFEREFNGYMSYLRAGTTWEMATTLAAAHAARMYLLKRPLDMPEFPEKELSGRDLFPHDRPKVLSIYSMRLAYFRKAAIAAQDPAGQFLAAGALVWQMSCRALTHPEFLYPGRAIWSDLLRGLPDWRKAAVECGCKGVLNDMNAAWFIPALLCPDGPFELDRLRVNA